MPASLFFSLQNDAILLKKGRRISGVQFQFKRLTIPNAGEGIVHALKALKSGTPLSEQTLERLVLRHDGRAALPLYYYCISRLESIGALCYTVAAGARHLATFFAGSAEFMPKLDRVRPDQFYRLSRFAYLRRHSAEMVLESPVSPSRAVIRDPAALELLFQLTKQPSRLTDLGNQIRRMNRHSIETFLNALFRYHFVENAEESNLYYWEFPDLLFYSESRSGKKLKVLGATHRFLNRTEPLPALKTVPQGNWLKLEKPIGREIQYGKNSFFTILEKRKSIREYDERRPISIKQISHFLYRVARVKKIIPKNAAHGLFYDVASRPYPGGGGCYELEFYLVVRNCEGIEPGLYYYDPKAHRLHQISSPTIATNELLQDALQANGSSLPQVLICLAARFARVSWKYESIAYSTILKNVGVLYQTMYLVATAMGLAPCALGCGNSELFARATGSNIYAEGTVGEFMLGSRKG